MPRRTNIEVEGVWLPNKGAELMAHTVVAELGRRIPGARFRSQAKGPDEARRAIGLEPVRLPEFLERHRKKALFKAIGEHWRRAGVDHVMDISGFAYGDHWGAAKAKGRAGKLLRQGHRVHLAPQAFGPFEDPELREEMRFILSGVETVAARDRTSKAHIEALGLHREIELIPDITLGLDISGRTVTRPDVPYGCLVLNTKLAGSSAMSEDRMIALFGKAAGVMRENGLIPLIVMHEPGADRPLSDRLAQDHGIEVVALEDARDIKAFVAGATCVVTARFHGLANALSCAVPAFAVSWSHKYRELLEDFGCPEACFEGDETAFLDQLFDLLRDASAQEARRNLLRTRGNALRPRISDYWDRIAARIRRH